MKLAAIMLIAFIIPVGLGAQEVRIEGAHHLPATTSPDGCWTVKPLYHDGKFVSYEWTEQHVDPPAPPQPPAPPKPPPAPVPPVVPTPQCQVVYYTLQPTPVPSPYTMAGAGCYSAPRGCGILRRIFGRCR